MTLTRDNRWCSKLKVPLPLSISKSAHMDQLQSSRSLQRKDYIKIQQYEYAELDILGSGYSSKVYLGQLCSDPRKQFAIKVVDRRKISKEKEHLQLLKQQMEIHQQLDHPNIVKCYHIIEKNHFLYFVLEYCPEGTLDSFIKKHQKLAESTTVTIMEQIIAGYKYLLEHKILHRDLKPPNILKSGHNWKICDFGFSVMGKKQLVGKINVGTPTYMAPQALQRTYYSPKTDIFSLGVICYQMLFGKAPWQHKNQQVLVSMMQQGISENKLSSISNRNLAQFIIRCCEPTERRRMNLKEFQQFSFWKEYESKQISLKVLLQDTEGYSKASSKTLSTMKDCNAPQSTCPSQTTNLSSDNHIQNGLNEHFLCYNKANIERQLYICQVIYALMKNYSILMLKDEIQKDLYLTVLARHSAYIIRRILYNKFNYLCLKKWEEYASTEHYQQLKVAATEISKKIEAFAKAQARRKSIITIRVFNKRYDDLTSDRNLSQMCVSNLKQYIFDIMTTFLKEHESQQRNQVTQTLLYLNKYYNYVNQIQFDVQAQSRALLIDYAQKPKQQIPLNFYDIRMPTSEFNKLIEEINRIHL